MHVISKQGERPQRAVFIASAVKHKIQALGKYTILVAVAKRMYVLITSLPLLY